MKKANIFHLFWFEFHWVGVGGFICLKQIKSVNSGKSHMLIDTNYLFSREMQE